MRHRPRRLLKGYLAMSHLELLPVLAYAAALATLVLASLAAAPGSWRLAAGLCAAFSGFTLWTLAEEGLIRFWMNHATSLTGNQVWFDLLIAVSLAFILMLPRARAQGMAILPWALAVALTASVALLAMMARLLWLERAARLSQGKP
jgi:hypothetical protein